MNVHEYQAKQLLREFGLGFPRLPLGFLGLFFDFELQVLLPLFQQAGRR